MTSKLAGQRAKFSRARAIYYSTSEEAQRQRATQLMAEVLVEARANGFTEDEVTQEEDVPDDVRQLAAKMPTSLTSSDDDPDIFVRALQTSVDTANMRELGEGNQFVYAYGYRCAPDRLKIGRCTGDVVARIAAQINTGTPDKPVLLLQIRTHDCSALERVLHSVLRLKGKKVPGAGAEWFITTRDEVADAYERVIQ